MDKGIIQNFSSEKRSRNFLRNGYRDSKLYSSNKRTCKKSHRARSKHLIYNLERKPAKKRKEVKNSRWTRSMDLKKALNSQSYLSIKTENEKMNRTSSQKENKRNSIERLFDQLVEKKRQTQFGGRYSLPYQHYQKKDRAYRKRLDSVQKKMSDGDIFNNSSNYEKLREMLNSIAYERDAMMSSRDNSKSDLHSDHEKRELSFSINKRHQRRKKNQR